MFTWRQEHRRRCREHDLATVCSRGDPCRTVDVVTDVPFLGEEWRSGVEADAHPNGSGR
jgi:hypothetical protein